ncbi:sensor histidine kinase [Puniceibacterium confluentis]|uniref:sensor histidine kinase n=1 Tax=Puniceibacterium confluentis TaxID=1958944 RepID=UPI0011B77C0F|nr:histidine kinase [Puniceibacterium confluentis]
MVSGVYTLELSQRLAASRSDRIIGLARLPLAFVILLAVWLDPTQPTRVPTLTYTLLLGYAAFAITVAILLFRPSPRPMLAVVAHLADLGVFTFLVYTTEGPTSPFFLLFTFSIVSAAFRWRWRGALWTSLAVLVLQVLSTVVFMQFVPDTIFETDRFLIRSAHVIVTGGMLVYFAYHQERIAEQASRLRPMSVGPWYEKERNDFLTKCAAYLGETFESPQVVLAMDEPEEPSAGAHIWNAGKMRVERVAPDVFMRLMSQPADAPVWINAGADWDELMRTTEMLPCPADPSKRSPLPNQFSGDAQILSVSVPSKYSEGRLYITNPKGRWWDIAVIAELLARQIGEGLDRIETAAVQSRANHAEERLSLARDLHDGTLQTLSGTALQLENLARLAESNPAAVTSRIRILQDWLVGEQRELRRLIRKLRPGQLEPTDGVQVRKAWMHELAEGLQNQWNIKVAVKMPSGELRVSQDVDYHLNQIIREAAANSARHGGVTKVDVTIGQTDEGLNVTITDDGSGLSTHGVFDSHESARLNIGPRSLRERVAVLGGALVIDSSARGLRLNIHLPMPPLEAA